jgi:CarD family transcriptional regulator
MSVTSRGAKVQKKSKTSKVAKKPAAATSGKSAAAAKPARSAKPAASARAAASARPPASARPAASAKAAASAKPAASAAPGTGAKSAAALKAAGAVKAPAAPRSVRTPRSKLRYKKNQQIVYPLQGVGQVVSIEERPFRSTRLLYYIIYLEVSDMTVMVPVERADELGIRPIVEKREALKALKLISEEYEPVPADWKLRYQMNLDLLKKGSVLDIATVVRALYHRSRIKELPILERKLYDSALRLLVDEVSFSLEKPKTEVEELVMSKLESN